MIVPANTTTTLDPAGATTPSVRIGDLMLERGLISRDQLAAALSAQKESSHSKLLGEILVDLGFVTEVQVLGELAQAYGVPFLRITYNIGDHTVLEIVPRAFLEKQQIVPLYLVNNTLTVAMSEPTNVFLIEEIERLSGHQVQIVVATARNIRKVLEKALVAGSEFIIDELADEVQSDELTLIRKQTTELTDVQNAADESPIIKLVNYLIFSAVQEGASDIHIEPDENALRIRFRVDGRLYEKMKPPTQMAAAVASRIKIMAAMDISERRIPQDGSITVMFKKHPIDLRVSTMPGKIGEKVVLRVIDNRSGMVTLQKLGFLPQMLSDLRRVIHQPNGVVLVTGPTGCGKSTTLYAILDELNHDQINISTVEDPVEYNLLGVNQFQTNDKAGFHFVNALRALLRQDPDIIMVGEIRDQDTAKIATQAALTGHLVLSTLHTNDAPSAVTRLFNIGVEPYLVAASIRSVLAQRLVRKICNYCKEPQKITDAIRKRLDRFDWGEQPIGTLYQGTGCSQCRNTGLSGRIGIFELYIPDDEALDAVSRGATLQELRQLAGAHGYTPLWKDGLEKVREGMTTLEELFTAISV